MKNKTDWKWYHWFISYLILIFLISLYSSLIVVPWYTVWVEYRDLKNGISVVARYENSEPLESDTKQDYEKKYKYNYTFENPTTRERVSYSTIGTGRDNHPGEEITIYYNPETGTSGYPEFWAICFGNLKLLLLSLGTLFWVLFIHLLPKVNFRKRKEK